MKGGQRIETPKNKVLEFEGRETNNVEEYVNI